MKLSTIAPALMLTFLAGTVAIAGPEHKQNDGMTADTQAETTKTLEDFVGEQKAPELFIGSKAPELQIAKFVKGESVDGFEEGQVYVVEFWATWCGPCIAAFPHLSSLQEEHGDNVRFIGVDVFERDTDQMARIERIEAFVEEQGERMSYTVAVEDGSAMGDNWLRPAKQNGIPTAFIVDGTGTIAWIGHPMGIDKVLERVVSGDFDAQDEREIAIKGLLSGAALEMFGKNIQTGTNIDDARQIAQLLINNEMSEDPQGLNQIAWMLLNAGSPELGMADYKLAHKATTTACEITEWGNWMVLDSHAQASFKTGDIEGAVKWQKKAVELTPEEYPQAAEELKATLTKYEDALNNLAG